MDKHGSILGFVAPDGDYRLSSRYRRSLPRRALPEVEDVTPGVQYCARIGNRKVHQLRRG